MGEKLRVSGIVWDLGEAKKKKECFGLAKMFVWVFHVADTVYTILRKIQTNVGQPNNDKKKKTKKLNNELEFGKVNTISKLQTQDTPWRRNGPISKADHIRIVEIILKHLAIYILGDKR